MKNVLLLFLLVFSTLSFTQNTEKEITQTLKITQKKCVPKKGYHLVLKEVLSDSRCPEGVNCIWAGEIKVWLSLYQDKKVIQEELITISSKLNQADADWFSTYLSIENGNIKSISVFPYPKDGKKINPKNYYIGIDYLK